MLRVTIDMISANGREFDKRLGVLDIENVGHSGSFTAPEYDYNARLMYEAFQRGEHTATGKVLNHDRYKEPVWTLVRKAIAACGL